MKRKYDILLEQYSQAVENIRDIDTTLRHLHAIRDRAKAYKEALERKIEEESGGESSG